MEKTFDEITGAVLDAAIKIHQKFGPGLLESIYERLLEAELKHRGFLVERQKSISFEYEGISFEDAFRLDLLVERKVIVELKAAENNNPVFLKQLKTYLVIMNLKVGLLVNFGMPTLKEGFSRIVNGLDPKDSPALKINLDS